jgi:hypothetical protein
MTPAPPLGSSERRIGWLAYAVTGLPLLIIFVRYLVSGGQVFLSDDLALIDLHTRQALHWAQQLGPFDHFGWNHPGPALFYLLATMARVLGSGAKAEFVGAIAINAVAASWVVRTVRRQAGSWVALWAGIGVGVLLFSISFTSPGDLTYSEGAAGAISSPWNPLVVILPTLLVAVLCADAVCGAPRSLLWAAVVGSFCVQTDIGTTPVVVVFLVLASAMLAAVALRARRGHRTRSEVAPGSASTPTRAGTARGRAWLVVGVLALVVIWIPPVIQQFTNHPGNITLIARFFFASHPTHDLSTGLWSVVAVNSVLLYGTSIVFAPAVPLGTPLAHAGMVLVITVLIVVAALALNASRRHRFGAALAAASLVGFVVGIASATRVVGPVWGYLMLWELGLPLLALFSLGTAVSTLVASHRVPATLGPPAASDPQATPAGRAARLRRPLALSTLALSLLVCGALCYRTVDLPPLSVVSDRVVQQSTALVTARLRPSASPILVQNAGLSFYDTFEFIGLVNELDQRGYRPKVSAFWRVQFGPGFVAAARVRRTVVLQPWSTLASARPGYLGRAGDMAVLLVR